MLFICYPKCSTCAKAKKYLEDKGINYDFRDIKIENPTADEIALWLKVSGLDVKKFFNTSGLLYKNLHLKDKLPLMEEKEKIQLLSTDGMLVKRPLLIDQGKVLVGFAKAEWDDYFGA
ncbi:MAG: arsenate reductase family protein [Oscillospiraceae bacterium]